MRMLHIIPSSLRNSWIGIACLLPLNWKHSRRKPSKEAKVLQEHPAGG